MSFSSKLFVLVVAASMSHVACTYETNNYYSGADVSSDTSGAFTFALDEYTPESQAVSVGQKGLPVLYLTVTAGDSGGCLGKITLQRGGVSSDGLLESASLYDMTNKPWILISTGSFNGSKALIGSTGLGWLICLKGGESRRYAITVDVTSSLSSGQTFALGIGSAQDIETSDSSSVGGSFPIFGNSFTIVAN